MEDENVETYSVLWVDTASNSSDEKWRVEKQLRSSINSLKIFADQYECKKYIRCLSDDERIVMIVNGQIAKDFIPEIHRFELISSIYIHSSDKKKYDQGWINEYSQIKCVKKDLDEIVGQIENDQVRLHRCRNEEPFSINLFDPQKNNDQFLCSQFLFNSLLQLKSFVKDKNALIKFCENVYRGNESELSVIKEFQRKYSSFQSLWWLTRNCFLTRIIHKALRKENYELLFLSRFFLQDIYQEIEKNKCVKSTLVYRTLLLTNHQFQLVQTSMGKFLSINSFFFTNLHRKQSISNVKQSNHFHRVLFEITADPKCIGIRPFANITSLSYFRGEAQILFLPCSIFRITKIDEQNPQLIIVRMTLTSILNEEQLKSIPSFDRLSFGQTLIDQRKLHEAKIYFGHFLNHLPFDHPEICQCYDALANIYFELNEYQSTVKYLKKCLQMKKETLNPEDANLASIYNRLTSVYMKNNDYTKAFQAYQIALKIIQEKYGEYDIHLVDCLNNIALLFKCQNKYEQTLEFYLKTLSIHQKCLSPSNPDLAMSYTNIGMTYAHLKEYDRALEYYNYALDIYQKILPSRHCLISMIYENLANIYYDQKQFDQGLLYYQKASDLYRQLLPSNHPDVLQINMIIKRLESKLKYS